MSNKEYCSDNVIFENIVSKKRRRNRKLWGLGVLVIALGGFVWLGIAWWGYIEAQAHIEPGYKRVDISSFLYREAALQPEDYRILFQQTGMGQAGVDYLFEEGLGQNLLMLQDIYFADVEVDCQSNTIITREERIGLLRSNARIRAYIPYVEDGDVLVSFNCHVFGWRNGHVAIVVDAKKRLTLEASELGTESSIVSMNHWERYPSFVILRLKDASKEERAAVAGYAEEYLKNISYSLQAGIVERMKQRVKKQWIPERRTADLKNEQQMEGTHCAHLVWYSYNQFGHDLDSDGGFIVTPRDLYESELWEVVQIYGM